MRRRFLEWVGRLPILQFDVAAQSGRRAAEIDFHGLLRGVVENHQWGTAAAPADVAHLEGDLVQWARSDAGEAVEGSHLGIGDWSHRLIIPGYNNLIRI